ncbi:MAG: energy transducer TonB [Alphaproteobacteria bacterium]|nr:energy transducer TonB [Alphaproteobacteria bacterium]MBL6940186.1 energy transducer TonB [Alphaproteobacteria bacterium]MBL7100273.1 energy transducer TonB [Alphaproteobacteria bacterium]
MQRPRHLISNTANRSTSHEAAIVGGVVVLHAFLAYALATGLAQRIVLEAPHLLTAEVVPQKQEEQPPPPPAKPEMVQPTVPTVPVPVIQIQPAQPPVHAVTVVQGPRVPVTPAPQPVVAPPSPAPPAPVAPTAARAVAGTHTIPPYPDTARRLGQSGTVQLVIALDANGAVQSVTVQSSSGTISLDEAAVAWVREHWRYQPATRDGKPVASTVTAAVRFDLTKAGYLTR